jgi:ankyrin repeat protein
MAALSAAAGPCAARARLVSRLVRAGADVRARRAGKTILHRAAALGDAAAVTAVAARLRELGDTAALNAEHSGRTALGLAQQAQHHAAVAALVAAGAV